MIREDKKEEKKREKQKQKRFKQNKGEGNNKNAKYKLCYLCRQPDHLKW